MVSIDTTGEWQSTFAGGHVGVLLINDVENRKRSPGLDQRKKELESQLRETYAGFSRSDFLKDDILGTYRNYYKKFKKTYHVQLQIESITLKNKHLPAVSLLVDANFMAEMESFVLTAGHDADLLEGAVRIDASTGDETLLQMNGNEQILKSGDMMMTDSKGVVCSIIYGQDKRTAITNKTRNALYVAYAPPGVSKEAVGHQLDLISDYVRSVATSTKIGMKQIFTA